MFPKIASLVAISLLLTTVSSTQLSNKLGAKGQIKVHQTMETNTLLNGEQLLPGGFLVSTNEKFALVFQSSGNLAIFSGNTELITAANVNSLATSGFTQTWTANTAGLAGTNLVMQQDGNLCINNNVDVPVWCAGTNGTAGSDTYA
jgi:hypothetical protein